jgi:subtilisin-like proprotein convertase family protein
MSTGLLMATLFAAEAQASFLPQNNLHLQDNLLGFTNVEETEFNGIIDKVAKYYSPIVKSHGGTLNMIRDWNDSTVNAYAAQEMSNWNVKMFGGLARRPEITPDGFTAVVCHEMGHHLGGFYFYANSSTEWAASEGQSDYFATHSCLPNIWRNEKDNNAKSRATASPFIRSQCDGVWHTTDAQNLCYRVASAGESLATMLSALRNGEAPKFETPDPKEVDVTSIEHPAAQCRLDTYLQGALCTQSFDEKIIPGRANRYGQNSKQVELLSQASSCHAAAGFAFGTRPRCWFAPRLQFNALKIQQSDVYEHRGNGNGILEPGEQVGVKLTLANNSEETTTGIAGMVFSRSADLSNVVRDITFPDLPPTATTTNASPFVLGISPNAKCGSVLRYSVRAQTNQGSIENLKTLQLGKLTESAAGASSELLTIPDGGDEVFTAIEVPNSHSVTEVAVSVDVEHTYPKDLTLTLEAPNGQQIVVYNRGKNVENPDLKKIKLTLRQPFVTSNAKGTWRLRARDFVARDSGFLKSWSLNLSHRACE